MVSDLLEEGTASGLCGRDQQETARVGLIPKHLFTQYENRE